MNQTRKLEIAEILSDLTRFKDEHPDQHSYGIKENIIFFKSLESFPKYLTWLLIRAPRIDGPRLIELIDLPFEKWDVAMHTKLIEVERRKFPGLIEPLVSKLTQFVLNRKGKTNLAAIGAGAMEVERQLISRLLEYGYDDKVTIVAFDRSMVAQDLAYDNLSPLKDQINIIRQSDTDAEHVDYYSEKGSKITVILANNDIFNLESSFPNSYFNASYHSLFKHHLDYHSKNLLDEVLSSVSQNIFEYDGYISWFSLLHIIPTTLIAWRFPVALNGAIISNLRYDSKEKIIESNKKNDLKFYSAGTYLRSLEGNYKQTESLEEF